MRSDCVPCWIDGKGQCITLRRCRFQEREFTEEFLQKMLHASPELLPVEDFDAGFGPVLSLGREIAGVDNMFISPVGMITLVETKLWRNPQATREVVAQILEYAQRVSSWSYDDLEANCRKALAPAPLAERGLYDLLCSRFPDDTPTEPEFVDAVQKSLKDARFLLLIVGDGIRVGLERLLGALQDQPRMLYTFGLVELQVFHHPEMAEGRLIVPQIVAYSTEVVRAVVRVHTTGHADVEVALETPPNENGNTRRRRLGSESEFFDLVSDERAKVTIQRILDECQEMGVFVQPGGSSLSFRLADPGGSKQRLTLFVIRATGLLKTGWLPTQLEKISLDPAMGTAWVASLARLFPGIEPKAGDPAALSEEIPIERIEERLGAFLELVGVTVRRIMDAAR